jgi:hypothetical protein
MKDDVGGRRSAKARRKSESAFVRYSDERQRKPAQGLGSDDPRLIDQLERIGQYYAARLKLARWWSTPVKRAKKLDKILDDLAFVRARFVESGIALTGGVGLFPGQTVQEYLQLMRDEVQRLKQTAEPAIESISVDCDELHVAYRSPERLALPQITEDQISRLQVQIDLHETWVRAIEGTERQLMRSRDGLGKPASRSSDNRDQSDRNGYLTGVLALWSKATGLAPPVEGRWMARAGAIANAASEAGWGATTALNMIGTPARCRRSRVRHPRLSRIAPRLRAVRYVQDRNGRGSAGLRARAVFRGESGCC